MSNFAKRRIWKYFLVLNPAEKLKFDAWLGLELQDRQISVQRLWQNLLCLDKAEISLSSEGKYSIEKKLWYKIYPGEDFDDSRFRKLSEQLIRQIEEFLAIEGFRKDRTSKDLHLLRELGLRNSFQLFQTIYRKVKSRLNRRIIRDEKFFRDHTLFDREFQKNKAKIGSQVKFELSDFFQSFDKWRLTEQANMMIFQLFQPASAPTPVVPADYFFNQLKKHPKYAQEPLLHIYTLLFELLTGKSDNFPIYFNSLKSYAQKINSETLRFLYVAASNHTARKASRTRERIYYEQYAQLIEWGLQKELILINGVLPSGAYKNIISTNLILAKKMDGTERNEQIIKAKHYLEDLKFYLPRKDQEDAYRFNKAFYFFTIGQFEKVEGSLGGQAYFNPGFNAQGRLLALMARYEMKEFTYLPTAIRSLKRYIQVHMKKDLPSGVYNSFMLHLRFFNRLVNAYTFEDYLKLKKAVEKTPRIFEKNWLIEKIDERLPSSKLLSTN
ncbi:MAG: hypothetical protein R8P61_20925 [Bacteroidia bacterium]|nr:hypothetical protein [Bacteroidia bacterium]